MTHESRRQTIADRLVLLENCRSQARLAHIEVYFDADTRSAQVTLSPAEMARADQTFSIRCGLAGAEYHGSYRLNKPLGDTHVIT
ncbi:MAG: hypothetical protein AB1810_03700 [Pseudomonadota bacterium]